MNIYRKITLLVLVALSWCVASSISEGQSVQPDPAAVTIALSGADLPTGFFVSSTRAWNIELSAIASYPALYQEWRTHLAPNSVSKPGIIRGIYALLPDRGKAGQAFHYICKQISQGGYRSNENQTITDSYVGDPRKGFCVILVDRAVFMLSISGIENREDLLRGLVQTELRRLGSIQIVPTLGKIAVNAQTLDKHVRASSPARVRLKVNQPEMGPIIYEFYVVRQGQNLGPGILFSQGLLRANPNGELDVSWDGRNGSGSYVPNGAYDLYFTATDNPGRRSEPILVKVNVNR